MIMNYVREYEIHKIIKLYPYLLDPELENAELKHERIYDNFKRADFVFYLKKKNKIIVVEVKRDVIDYKALSQLLHYMEQEERLNHRCEMTIIGYLVGKYINKNVKNRIKNLDKKIYVKFINIDLPVKVKICSRCRKANDILATRCKWCGYIRFIY